MLKTKLTISGTNEKYKQIPYDKISVNDSYDLCTVKTSEKNIVNDGDTIHVSITKSRQNVNFILKYIAEEVSDDSFSMQIESKYTLIQKSIEIYDNYAILTFENFHFFDASNDLYKIYVYNPYSDIEENEEYENEINVRYSTDKSIQINFNENDFQIYFWQNLNRNFHYFTIKRDNFVFTNFDTLQFYKNNYVFNLNVPVSQSYKTNLFQREFVEENFIEEEKEKAINRIIDMEKDVYYPVYELDGANKLIEKITFNLHFRKRYGDDWTVDNNSFWNGSESNQNGEAIGLSQGYSVYKNADMQSDLLCYLGFTDSDVRYQKSKLKKSFLRLLFYDSDNQTNQNLVYSSTIFVDSGKLFGKYCNHIEDYPYYSVYDENKDKLTGIRVDREPMPELFGSSAPDDEIEKYRLSSQFNVTNKYEGTSSSDGFYLYLFKENDPKFIGSTLYLKIEFNHAGYGRTLPFMYPTNEDGLPLSYEGILNEWNKYVDSEGNIVGFTLNTFYNYSYIKIECKYDRKLKRHVYYIKNQCDDNINVENNQMIFNLYEAKLT